MRPDLLILLYVGLLLAGLAGLALYTERRKRSFSLTPSQDRIFRCGQCNFVYTDDPDVDRSRCPQCGRMNESVKF
ncbi:MAG TPA: hypothetical protein VL527_10630 [Dongiaceae bacterium]|nr:hypothetical protein [Dongiaceae bacterium]